MTDRGVWLVRLDRSTLAVRDSGDGTELLRIEFLAHWRSLSQAKQLRIVRAFASLYDEKDH